MISTDEQPFLFASVVPEAACQRCFDTRLWLTPLNKIETCPRVQMREPHAEQNEASFLLYRAAVRLVGRKLWINPQAFDFARILTNFTTINPCPRAHLETVFFGDTNLSSANVERRVKLIIEELRKTWLLPIGSRKFDPSGYWIITDLEDFKSWIAAVKSAPITQLSTIHKVAKHNFPIFAEQLELEFWNDLQSEMEDAV